MKISADFFQLANRSISRWTQYCPPLQSLSISIKCMSAVRKLWESMLTMMDGAGKERCFHWQHEIRISGLTFRGRHIIIICYSMYMIIFFLEYHLMCGPVFMNCPFHIPLPALPLPLSAIEMWNGATKRIRSLINMQGPSCKLQFKS